MEIYHPAKYSKWPVNIDQKMLAIKITPLDFVEFYFSKVDPFPTKTDLKRNQHNGEHNPGENKRHETIAHNFLRLDTGQSSNGEERATIDSSSPLLPSS